MKASELRIGNWFKEDILEQTFAQITAEQILDFYDDPLDDFYKPIPLTEEWLFKFGFERKYDTCFQYKDFILNDKFIMMDIDITIQLKYVHELQNLYFALTREEL
jgi:hypothetical protein